MITKGQVLNINSDNTLQVRIPLFESATGTRNNQIVKCTVCYNPGNLNGYVIGDVVFVAFEDNEIDKPVVIGKLYLGDEKEATNHSYSNSLTVEGNASLPASTTIGNLDFVKIKNIFNELDILNTYIDQLEDKIQKLNTEIAAINVPAQQATFTIIKDELTNINGRELTNYVSEDGTYTDSSSGVTYDIKTIKYKIFRRDRVIVPDIPDIPSIVLPLTEDQAKDYMEYMTGSRFLPVYNYEKPQNSLFIMSDKTIWKPQYEGINSLVLYKVNITLN